MFTQDYQCLGTMAGGSQGCAHLTPSQEQGSQGHQQAPSWGQRSQGWDVGPGLECGPGVAPEGQGLMASGTGMGPWSLGGWGCPVQLGRASPPQVCPQFLAGRCHPRAKEPLPFWTSS